MAGNRKQRLYLAKGNNEDDDIYVDTICLPQHQYDGIRFLYKQYKKGKPGVILSDPPGYGKRVQTVLFLSAMHHVITLPTLILCNEGIEDVWIQQFHQWTTIGSDVGVQKETHNKSMIVIGTLPQINVVCRREWGILVVDDNNISKEVLRAHFNTKYRIWLTSIDMKKNLQTFSSLYKWLYPRDKFVIEDFQADKKPSAVYSNSIRLDAFMEDIVIRMRDVAVPSGKTNNNPDVPRVTRKNKDATGLKIKRSKPLPDCNQDASHKIEDTSSEHNISKKLDENRGDYKRERNEDFLVNLENERVHKIVGSNIDAKPRDGISNRSHEVSNCPIIKSGNNVPDLTDMDIDFNPGDNEVPRKDFVLKSHRQDSFTLLSGDFIHSENIVIKYDSETQDYEIENDIPAKKTKFSHEINVSEDIFSSDVILSETKSDNAKHDKNAKTNENIIDIDDILTQAY